MRLVQAITREQDKGTSQFALDHKGSQFFLIVVEINDSLMIQPTEESHEKQHVEADAIEAMKTLAEQLSESREYTEESKIYLLALKNSLTTFLRLKYPNAQQVQILLTFTDVVVRFQLKSLMWTTDSQFKDAMRYPEVMLQDITESTNRLSKPFLYAVGMDGHCENCVVD